MKPVIAASALFLLSGCSAGGMNLVIHGTLPNPIFELTAGSIGGAPCLTEFRVLAVRPANPWSVPSWSVRKPSGCLKPASVIYGSLPEGFVERYPGEEGAKSYPAVHWPLPLESSVLYQVSAKTSDGRTGVFFVEFDGETVSVTQRP